MKPSYEQIPVLTPVNALRDRLKTINQSKTLSVFEERMRTQILSDVTSDVKTRRVVLWVPEKSDLLDQAIDYTMKLFWSHGIPIVLSDKTYNCEYGDFVVQLLQHRPNSDIKTFYLGVTPSQQPLHWKIMLVSSVPTKDLKDLEV